jgi:hypothetical protein
MHQQHHDEIIHKRVRRIADDFGISVDQVHAVLDHHPIEIDRDKYLKRTLALELLRLDELEEAFRDKAMVDRDVAAGVLLVKVAERRATLLGMNAPGHAVQVIQHDPPNKPTSTERIAALIDRIRSKTQQDDLPPAQQDTRRPLGGQS